MNPFVCCLTLIFISLCSSHGALSPVIFTPGWTASTLHVEVQTSEPILPGCPLQSSFDVGSGTDPINCQMAWLTMEVTISDGTWTESSPPGVQVGVKAFNSSYGCGGCYGFVESGFISAGWKEGQNFFFANWDWRTSPLAQNFFGELQSLVESAYELNSQTPVFLMGHSSGPYMNYNFLYRMSQEWKSKYIAGAISFAGDYSGQGLMVEHSLVGWAPFNIDSLSVRNITQTWLTMPFKYPSPFHYGSTTIMQTPSRNYTGSTEDVAAILAVVGLDLVAEIYPLMQKYLPNPYPTHPGVNLYAVWGSGFQTALGPIYNNEDFSSYPAGQIIVNGDSVHEEITNSACLIWQNSTEFSFYGQEFPGVNHGGIVSDAAVLAQVVAYVLAA